MNVISTAQLQEMVKESLDLWSHYTISVFKEKMVKQKIVFTEQTLNSLQAQVMNGSGEITGKMLLSFLEAGRFKDMKQLTYKKMPPIEVFEDYIKQVGISKFSYVPGYKNGQFPTSQSKAINRIAWGIAKNRENNYAHKPARWYNITFKSAYNRLIDSILTDYQNATGNIMSAGFKYNS